MCEHWVKATTLSSTYRDLQTILCYVCVCVISSFSEEPHSCVCGSFAQKLFARCLFAQINLALYYAPRKNLNLSSQVGVGISGHGGIDFAINIEHRGAEALD